jgi:hypothetical protein
LLFTEQEGRLIMNDVIKTADIFTIVNRAFVEACTAYTIRNGKRFNRYDLNLTKDLKRIKFLLKRSWDRFPLVMKEIQETFGVSGWKDINLSDLKVPASADFAEIIALIEYWGLWGSTNEILALTGKH